MRTLRPLRVRLDVNIARAQFHRLFEQVVDRAHDGRAAGQIAQVLDIVVGMGGSCIGDFGQSGVVIANARGENGGDVLERGDGDADAAAEHDLGGLHRRRVIGIGNRQLVLPVRRLKGEDHHLAQKAAGKPADQGCGFHQLRQAQARNAVEAGYFVSEVVGR